MKVSGATILAAAWPWAFSARRVAAAMLSHSAVPQAGCSFWLVPRWDTETLLKRAPSNQLARRSLAAAEFGELTQPGQHHGSPLKATSGASGLGPWGLVRLFYGCSCRFHLSGDDSRDRHVKGS